jgi:hypothetical protein
MTRDIGATFMSIHFFIGLFRFPLNTLPVWK